MELDAKIEAILFWKGEPVSRAELSRFLNASFAEVAQGLRVLEGKLAGRGIALVRTDDEVALATASEANSLILQFQQEERASELSRAALETLAIILYRAPLSRRDIEYIRGVNVASMLRTLLLRGLIRRVTKRGDERTFLYQPTMELLTHLGIQSREEMPEFEEVKKELDSFKENRETETNEMEEPAPPRAP